MVFTLCSSEAIIRKAGLNANSTIVASNAALAEFSTQAEGWINSETRVDWVTDFGNVGTEFKGALAEACAAIAANEVIKYDMSGFTSRAEAQTMLDVNRDVARLNISFLKKTEHQETMGVK